MAFLRPWALIVGFMILFSTQLVVFELLTRQFVDGAHAISPRFRKFTGGDPRRFYYPFMLRLTLLISAVTFLAPAFPLRQVSADSSTLPTTIIPSPVISLNPPLPTPAG